MAASRRRAAVAALGLLLWGGDRAAAQRSLTPAAPEFPPSHVWINSKPLTMRLLRRRKAVVVAFINMANVNSVRSLAVLGEWFERYGLDGLMVVGVHTPDYDFQKEPQALMKTARRLAVQFPIVLDNDRSLWKAYNVEAWPTFNLVDASGKIVFDLLGEGRYAEFEGEIRSALESVGGVTVPKVASLVEDPPKADCGVMTSPVPAGTARGAPVGFEDLMKHRATSVFATREGELSYQGTWNAGPEALTMARENRGRFFQASVVYRGAAASAVLGPGVKPQPIYILQDERWIRPEEAGKDIRYDKEEASFVWADEVRLFDLVRNAADDLHEIIVVPRDAGARLYEFSFSDRCLAAGL